MIEFGDWLPDRPKIGSAEDETHLLQAKNVLPTVAGYAPFRSFTALSGVLGSRVRGAVAFWDKNETVHVYAGDATKLYELQSDTSWGDFSGAIYTATAPTARWRGTQFGDLVLFTNFTDAIQVKTMSAGSNFADLAGSPPKAKHITTFRDFVVVGYTDTSASEIRWCAINDVTIWTIGTSQADEQIIPDGGFVQGFATGDVLLVFQQRKIRVVQYVGPPLIMQIDVLEQELGCLEAASICQHGRKVFFLADNGFQLIDNLTPAVNIGELKINDFFFGDVNLPFLYRMSSAVDPTKSIAYWCYPSTASPDGVPDTILIYYWPRQRWSIIRISIELVFNAMTLGYTLEGLDALATSGIDLFTIPLDDPILQGGSLRFGAFSASWAYGVFAGSTLEATIETCDVELVPGKRAYISGVRPVTDADSLSLSVASRERAMNAEAYTVTGTLESHGMVSLENAGRYHRCKQVIAAADAWTIAQGLDLEFAEESDI